MDENERLKEAVRKFREEEMVNKLERLNAALVIAKQIIDKEPSIDRPKNINDEGVEIDKVFVGKRCAIVKYKGHYFLYNTGNKVFAPCATYDQIKKEFYDVEGNKG